MSLNHHIRVLLASDHDLLRASLRGVLRPEQDIEVVGEAREAEELIRLIASLSPGVLVMDLRLPDSQTFEAVRVIRRTAPDTRILIISQRDDRQYVSHALSAGADGYLLVELAFEELAQAVRAVSSSRSFFTDRVLSGLLR
jgi:DNA-binding NarL/FixJ family response regulator